jgi:putative transcriptional regulator
MLLSVLWVLACCARAGQVGLAKIWAFLMDLTSKLLIAMPGMSDPRFDKSVVFLCAHSASEGAMGLVINHMSSDISFVDLLKQVKVSIGNDLASNPGLLGVHIGGPVEHTRGFVLHSRDYAGSGAALCIDDRFAMTATIDILEDIALGRGPSQALLALGYAGWGPGQLESEILANAWLTADATAQLVFETRGAGKWEAALSTLGVDPVSLSSAAGRA